MGDDIATGDIMQKTEDSKNDMTEKVKKEKRTRGVTDVITQSGATEEDLKTTQEMRMELEQNHPGESEQGMKNRILVLEKLEALATEWVIEVAKAQQVEDIAPTMKLCTFGSYRLGAVNPGSDIDALLLGPKFVTREHFFTGMVNKLRQHKDVTSLLPVPDAYTPIVSLKFLEVEIDLLYCQLDMDTIPKDLNLTADDRLLQGLDEKDLRSINGCRVAEMIIHMVPDHKIYTDTLKFIKCWAKRRGIYSNVMGYFGGITWALCVARVCQLYPNYCMSMLVHKFFRVFDQWNWSKPILLCPIPETYSGIMQNFKVWNPKVSATDRSHLMPVITPAFPNMNSTHNVTESTKRVICDEIHRGYQICKDVESNKALHLDLYKSHRFFNLYRNYLMIIIEVQDEDGFRRYSGWVESKIRLLVSNLESTAGLRVHPYSRPCSWATVEDKSKVPKEELNPSTHSTSWFIGISFTQDNGAFIGQTVDIRPAVSPFIDVIQEWKDLGNTQVKMRLTRVPQAELPAYCHFQEDPLRAKSSKFKMHAVTETAPAEGTPSPRRTNSSNQATKAGNERHPSCSSQRSNRHKRQAPSEERQGEQHQEGEKTPTSSQREANRESRERTSISPRKKARTVSETRSDHTTGTTGRRKREKTETEAAEDIDSSSAANANANANPAHPATDTETAAGTATGTETEATATEQGQASLDEESRAKRTKRESESPTRRRNVGSKAEETSSRDGAGAAVVGTTSVPDEHTGPEEAEAESKDAESKDTKLTSDTTMSPVMEEKEEKMKEEGDT